MKKSSLSFVLTMSIVLVIVAGCSQPENSEERVVEPEPTENRVIEPEQTKPVNPYMTVSIGDIIQFGNNDWLVLEIENDKALIISDKVLMSRMYCNTDPTTWEKSSIRQYLNDSFFNDSFSEDEKKLIIASSLKNTTNPFYNIEGGNDTTDSVFLLSIDEAVKYFGSSGNVKELVFDDVFVLYSIDDEYNDMRIGFGDDGTALNWWLRSSGSSGAAAVVVSDNGEIILAGSSAISGNGVRPAMWISIKNE